MSRKQIILRSLFMLLVPAGIGLFQSLAGQGLYGAGNFALILLMWITLEVIILVLLALIQFIRALLLARQGPEGNKHGKLLLLRKDAGSYLLAAGLVLVVGASTCYGGATVIDAFL